MVCEEAFSQQFIVFFACSRVLFVSSILLVDFCCTVFADGPWAHRGWSVIEGAVLEVRGLFSDGPSQPRGQSA
jgi:hypothetical protein